MGKWWSNLNYRYKLMICTFLVTLVISLLLTSQFLELSELIKNYDKCHNSEIGCGIMIYTYTIIFLYWTAIILVALNIILQPLAWLFGKYRESKIPKN